MFYSLTGKIIAFDAASVVIECGGVGFLCATSTNTLNKIGSVGCETCLYTYLSVREDALELFGFADRAELDTFKKLISVNGVGPKAALAILSTLSTDDLAFCIACGDSKTITKAPGVGPKLAQRIVLELKNKIVGISSELTQTEVASVSDIPAQSNSGEAISALMVLGYSQSDAARAIAKVDKSLSVQEIIKAALKNLSKGV